MGSLATRNGQRRDLKGSLVRLVPFGSLAGLGTLAVVDAKYFLAAALGSGAIWTGRRIFDRRGNERRELSRRARENVKALSRVAREDRTSSSQMKRLAALQEGLIESWELLPEEYRPLITEDMFTILNEVEGTIFLARRRAALRRHVQSLNRREVSRRIKGLVKDLAGLEADSPLRAPFESALAGRREELAGFDEILAGISVINAQLESAESMLGSLRGELLGLDTSLAPRALDSGLTRLKEKVGYFRRSMDEVTRNTDTTVEELSAR